MTTIQNFLWLVTLAYLMGSTPFGKMIGLARGVDIQKVGSGNIGFANAFRTLGWRPAAFVLLGDVLKGAAPVLLAAYFLSGGWLFAVGLAAIAGHLFPVWLKGRGGKGIATGLGVTIALNPFLAVFGLAVYIGVIAVVRKSAPASIVASWSLPLFCLWLAPALVWFYVILAVLALWTHRNNVRALRKRWSYAR